MYYKYIAIEGNIGAGKTTLAQLLSEVYNGRLILEEFHENPYLSLFYENPEKYALQLETSFLLDRYKQLNTILSEPNIFQDFVIADYMLSKSLLFSKINLSTSDFKLYSNFFDIIKKRLPMPEIVFYLHADTEQLKKNIQKRGRSYEQNINRHYLAKIERIYFEYFKQNPQIKVVVIDVNGKDWISDMYAYESLLGVFEQHYKVGMNYVSLNNEFQ
ncbi:MAG: deoxynucleoside kinase [Chitinophagales bacterium]|nr:deoxynucleoside kinase [Chitinophagales bacterium]